jgi:alpha-glucosidase
MDVINLLSKHPELPDAPVTNPNEEWQYAPMYFANGQVVYVALAKPFIKRDIVRPRIHEFLREMDDKVLSSECAL